MRFNRIALQKKSIWGNGTDSSFNIWGSDFGLSAGPTSSALDLDFGALLPSDPPPVQVPKDTKKSNIPSMPSSALTVTMKFLLF